MPQKRLSPLDVMQAIQDDSGYTLKRHGGVVEIYRNGNPDRLARVTPGSRYLDVEYGWSLHGYTDGRIGDLVTAATVTEGWRHNVHVS